jgi:hypothetical protein
VLANEMLATRLALAAGLTVPAPELVDVTPWLIENTQELEIDLGRRKERCKPGLQFGSRFVGGLMPGQVVDFLAVEQLCEIHNLAEFAGILALDKWTSNSNGRQAVFVKRARERRYRAVFIDFGYCFHAGEWRFEDVPLRGIYYRNDVYQMVCNWDAFEPWLSRLETMPADTVWAAANDIPPEWYGGDLAEMETLVEKLLARQSRIRDLIELFRVSDRRPFPNWGQKVENVHSMGWNGADAGTSIVQRMRVQ